jgi:small subunit ribosomal protein S2
MSRLPDAVFIVDSKKEQIASRARKLKIPVIGIVDTNQIPTRSTSLFRNDDALRAIRLFASKIAEAVMSGRGRKESVDAEAARGATTWRGKMPDARRDPRGARETAPSVGAARGRESHPASSERLLASPFP